LYPSGKAPAFSKFGGQIAPDFKLYLTNLNATGTIYYTTNGADPRVYGSGAVSAGALAQTGGAPLVLNSSLEVKARWSDGANWSALVVADFTLGSRGVPLRITELMYNPVGGDAYEFLELQNVGSGPVDVSGYSLDGIAFVFPNSTVVNAGERLVLGSAAN